MIKIETMSGLVEMACKAQRKWGLYLSYASSVEDGDLQNRVDKESAQINTSLRHPDLKKDSAIKMALLSDGWILLLLDTEKEMFDLYRGVDGDDTQGHIYALTCSPEGQLQNGNT